MTTEIPRQILQEVEARAQRTRAQDRSLWALVQSIHSAPVLRDFVTLESQPLCPWVIPGENGAEAEIHLLVSIPVPARGGTLQAPWGYIAWSWPSRRLLTLTDVRQRMQGVPSLPRESACTREFAAAVEAALQRGEAPPAPPPPIPDLVRRARGREAVPTAVGTGSARPEPASKAVPAHRPEVFNLVTELMPQIDAARRLLRAVGSPSLEQEWQRIYTRVASPHFSVAVLGERSRGKSTLINRILGQDLLPVTRVPQAARILEVAYSPEPGAEEITESGGRNLHSWTPDAPKDLLVREGEAAAPLLKIGLPHPWLEATGIRLVEIPNCGEQDQAPLSRAIDSIAACDAVLVVVNASMALALTEKAFVEQHVLARKVPRVALVLTHLDTVREQERQEIVDFVRRKVAAWGAEIAFYTSLEGKVLPAGNDQETLTEQPSILDLLTAWAGDPQHRSLVRRQVTANLQSLLSLVRAHLVARKQAANAAAEEGLQRLEEERRQIGSRRLEWEDLRLACDRRHLEARAWLNQEVGEQRQRLIQLLQYQVRHSGHPKTWWEQDLPYRLNCELAAIGRTLEKPLEKRITTDAGWLVSQVQKQFAGQLQPAGRETIVEFEPAAPAPLGEELRDLTQMSWLIRGGSLAVASVGYFVLPFGLIFSGSAVLLGEIFLRKTAGQQRQTLLDALPEVVDPVIDGALASACRRLEEIYRELGESIRSQAETWESVQREALEKKAPDRRELAEIDRRLAEVDQLAMALAA